MTTNEKCWRLGKSRSYMVWGRNCYPSCIKPRMSVLLFINERERERERVLLFRLWSILLIGLGLWSHPYCVGQFCPVFKLYGKRSGPILSSFVQMEQERARPNIQCEGKQISEDSRQMNGQNYPLRRGEACLWGIGPCPRTMVTSGLLSEVSGELINHSEQRLGRTL